MERLEAGSASDRVELDAMASRLANALSDHDAMAAEREALKTSVSALQASLTERDGELASLTWASLAGVASLASVANVAGSMCLAGLA